MKTLFHAANARGHANHGWLDTYHSFSFAGFFDPDRMRFGTLRVLNDDTVEGGQGFGTHPHKDMEIISIPLEGALEHKDSTGVTGVIRKGEIQVMTAGKGVHHSEYNHHRDEAVKFLQIWVFPREKDLEPGAQQMNIQSGAVKNDFQQIVSPHPDDEGLWINQDAWFSWADFDKGTVKEYKIRKKGNGVYVFVLNGKIQIGDTELNSRDGLGIWDTDSLEIRSSADGEFLLMDIPMELPEFLK